MKFIYLPRHTVGGNLPNFPCWEELHGQRSFGRVCLPRHLISISSLKFCFSCHSGVGVVGLIYYPVPPPQGVAGWIAMASVKLQRSQSAVQSPMKRPPTAAIRPLTASRPRRPYSAYTQRGAEEQGQRFDAPETNREWWRHYVKVWIARLGIQRSRWLFLSCAGNAFTRNIQSRRLCGWSSQEEHDVRV